MKQRNIYIGVLDAGYTEGFNGVKRTTVKLDFTAKWQTREIIPSAMKDGLE